MFGKNKFKVDSFDISANEARAISNNYKNIKGNYNDIFNKTINQLNKNIKSSCISGTNCTIEKLFLFVDISRNYINMIQFSEDIEKHYQDLGYMTEVYSSNKNKLIKISW